MKNENWSHAALRWSGSFSPSAFFVLFDIWTMNLFKNTKHVMKRIICSATLWGRSLLYELKSAWEIYHLSCRGGFGTGLMSRIPLKFFCYWWKRLTMHQVSGCLAVTQPLFFIEPPYPRVTSLLTDCRGGSCKNDCKEFLYLCRNIHFRLGSLTSAPQKLNDY